MKAVELFQQAYSRNGISPQQASSVFKGVVVIHDPFSSRICDCDDEDPDDCDC